MGSINANEMNGRHITIRRLQIKYTGNTPFSTSKGRKKGSKKGGQRSKKGETAQKNRIFTKNHRKLRNLTNFSAYLIN